MQNAGCGMRNAGCGMRNSLAVWFALAGAMLAAQSCSAWRASFEKGVDAYRHARYGEAVENLERAAASNPGSAEVRVYLANSYLKQYKPGSSESSKAEENLRRALDIEPSNIAALDSLAWLQMNEALNKTGTARIALLDQAAHSYRKLTSLDPQSSKAFYSLGLVTWLKAHERLVGARARLGLEPDDEGPISDVSVRRELTPIYDDAIRQLQRALEIDPKSGDAMLAMSLCLTDGAELASDDEGFAHTMAEAREWARKSRGSAPAH